MNLVDVAKQEGLDKDIALDILTKCIPHNKSLSLFTETFMVEDIPGVFAEKLINAYNNSQVNLKTGSVISPSEELSKIKVCINPPVFLVTVNEEVEDEDDEDAWEIQSSVFVQYPEDEKDPEKYISFATCELADYASELYKEKADYEVVAQLECYIDTEEFVDEETLKSVLDD